MKIYKIKISIYKLVFHYMWGEWNEAQFEKYLKKEKIEQRPEGVISRLQGCQVVLDDECFVWTLEPPHTANKIGVLVHELFHAVIDIGHVLAIRPGPDSEEFYAYMQGYLTEEILRRVWAKSPPQEKD